MAVAHDLGKVDIADKKGGLWGDEPPRRFGGHAKAGVSVTARLAERLGLEASVKNAMKDASAMHMDIHDLPEKWGPHKLINFVDNHTPPEEAKKVYKATVDELIDLAHADHQGRFQTEDVPTDLQYTYDEEAPEGAIRPVFKPEPFRNLVSTARTAINEISGFDILRDELGEPKEEVPNDKLAAELAQRDDCRTPDEWVGEELNTRRVEYIRN